MMAGWNRLRVIRERFVGLLVFIRNHIRVVHVLWSREGLQRPVEEAVDEDQASTAGPDKQDGDKGHAQVIDHL